MHFEELWEKCENLNKEFCQENNSEILDKLLLQINLYKTLNQKTDIPIDEQKKIRSRIIGEILFALTHLSLNDDINVFSALNEVYQIYNTDYNEKFNI